MSRKRNRPEKPRVPVTPENTGQSDAGELLSRDDNAQIVSPFLLAFLSAVLVLLTLFVFAQMRHQKFIGYDDQAYVYENPRIMQGLTSQSIHYAFTQPVVGNYHPLTVLSLLLDVELFGLNAGAMKLVNLALHIGSVLLLFFALRSMTGRLWASAFVAAIFAIHPLHVEPVAWISSRKDMLSGFFMMAGFLCYARFARRNSAGWRGAALWYVPVAFLLGLALMSKPVAVTFPCVLLLLDWWPLGRVRQLAARRGLLNACALLVLEKLPLFLIAALGAYSTVWAQRADKAVAPLHMFSMPVRIENAFVSYAQYILLTVWPRDLSVHYPHPGSAISPLTVAASLLFLLIVSAAVAYFGRKRSWLWVGWLWFLGVLVPMIGILQVGAQAMADRYMYIPQTGLAIIAAWGAVELADRIPRTKPVLVVLAVLAVAGYAAAAHKQAGYWENSETLFRRCVEVNPNNGRMQNSLGSTLMEEGRPGEAEPHLLEAIRLDPGSANQRTNLGTILMDQGRIDEAINLYKESLKYEPDHVRTHFNLGSALYRKGDINGAAECYFKAARLEPTYVDAWFWAGNAFVAANRPAEAIPCYKHALELMPGHADAAARLAQAQSLVKTQPGQNAVELPVTPDAAKAAAEETVARMRERTAARPEDTASYYDLGKALFGLSRYAEAADAFQKVIEKAPNNAHAWYQLGNCHISAGKTGEAQAAYEEAIRQQPDHAFAHGNLGTALLNQGDTNGAIREYQEANRLDPTYADGHNNLGTIYYQQGRFAEAKTEFEQALKINPAQPNARENLERAQAMLEQR